jgi:hypothetical protein
MNQAIRVTSAGAIGFSIALTGCGSPTPPMAERKGPPAPPPAAPPPVPEPKPAPLPAKPQPDPFEVAMDEVRGIVLRYGQLYASVKDEATADKAVGEIGKMTVRMHELAAEISKLPFKPGQEKHALALSQELAELAIAPLSNADMQRVLADPDSGVKLIVAHQNFMVDGIGPLGREMFNRQVSAIPDAAKPQPGTDSP